MQLTNANRSFRSLNASQAQFSLSLETLRGRISTAKRSMDYKIRTKFDERPRMLGRHLRKDLGCWAVIWGKTSDAGQAFEGKPRMLGSNLREELGCWAGIWGKTSDAGQACDERPRMIGRNLREDIGCWSGIWGKSCLICSVLFSFLQCFVALKKNPVRFTCSYWCCAKIFVK